VDGIFLARQEYIVGMVINVAVGNLLFTDLIIYEQRLPSTKHGQEETSSAVRAAIT
jgi:hypothetical protein